MFNIRVGWGLLKGYRMVLTEEKGKASSMGEWQKTAQYRNSTPEVKLHRIAASL